MLAGKGQGRSARGGHDLSAEFTTLNKDGKPVWEPGLPAEVTSRRVHKPVKKEAPEEAAIACDLRNTLKLPPGPRADWLDKALRAIPQGRAKVHDVFNIVTHPKFVLGVPERIGRRMLRRVAESLDAFSDKQRTTLVAKCKLAELFQASAPGMDGDDDDEDDDLAGLGDGSTVPMPEDKPPVPRSSRGKSRSRSRRRRSGTPDRSRRSRSHSRSRRRSSRAQGSGANASPTRDARQRTAQAGAKQPPEEARPPPTQTASSQKELSAEERASIERAFVERQRQREEERKKIEADKRAFDEREKKRKAKLGSAFLCGDEEEEEAQQPANQGTLLVRKQEKVRGDELSYADAPPAGPDRERPRAPVAILSGQDPRFVEAMGGDKILAEAHAILQSAAESGRLAPLASVSQSPPRARRKRSRSRRGPDVRSSGSYRSPTPDGRARGQARAARKAKMIASLMGINGMGPR